MPPRGVAGCPASFAAAMGLVLLVALASLPVVSRPQVPPVVQTVTVGRVDTSSSRGWTGHPCALSDAAPPILPRACNRALSVSLPLVASD